MTLAAINLHSEILYYLAKQPMYYTKDNYSQLKALLIDYVLSLLL